MLTLPISTQLYKVETACISQTFEIYLIGKQSVVLCMSPWNYIISQYKNDDGIIIPEDYPGSCTETLNNTLK